MAVSAIVLAAIYMLWMYERTMTGPTPAAIEGHADMSRREASTVVPLLVALLALGVYPMPLLNVINPYVETTLASVGVDDDPPVVPASDKPGRDSAEGGHE